ncbi:MAG: class I SAM-dependent methyltransferase [Anaerolineales bacterium]
MFLGIGVLSLVLAMIPMYLPIRAILIISAVIFVGLGLYLSYIAYQFSAKGGGFQEKLWQVVLEHLGWDGNGRALDIGTGNGPLAIRIAKKYPTAQIIGIDYWGKDWEYSQNICKKNAGLEGVSERTEFKRASASNLPFADEQFEAVVSHFVFHEVLDTPNKIEVIKEALRVLKKGGVFSFQDMFLDEKLYGKRDNLMKTLQSWGLQEVQFLDSHEILSIPRLLNTSRALGNCSMIYGRK